ncbi:alkaline phosphatase D family protein [Allonocardiopsis opalescens]|uniref:Alkaline phosphatase D n=1 Tax=Allonocardiopsis opalescens TaxID=1144618 RepID=A0A2T0Q1I7_9ACTN|nr:alkaline phosphatase D family protein [Allonocardiopsis opalescens]PRX97666.1 alkaline phosphatase D [Allonocardiopsis opalescens]
MTDEPSGPARAERRRFLAGVAGVAAAAALAQLPADPAAASPRPSGGGYPFTLGVASGDPTAGGVVLWTRLVPAPYEPGGGMPDRAVPVEWQVAADDRFRRIVRRGTSWALPELAHSVHVEVAGLAPDREWFYRFRYRGEQSPAGRTRTAPWHGSGGRFSFAVASCQAWDNGYYPSYAHMAGEDLDLVLHLGDYVYEGGIPADGGLRRASTPDVLRAAPRDLARWRMQYALYKSDPDLQAAHARFPWSVTWDDHEVQNDYANTRSQYEGDIGALRAAAYQAWYEHQPVRAPARPGPDGPRIYRRLRWGSLAQLDILDGRQYRSVPPAGWGEADASPASYEPSVTMLGFRQERWLYDGLAASRARWNLLGNNVMLARLDHDGAAGERLWHDAWDGFPAARNRLTRAWVRHGVSNPVALTGDWHSTFANDIKRDFDDPDSPVVASEIVATSISSNGDGAVYGPYYGPMIPFNPHIRYFDGDRRGYLRCELTRARLRADLRVVSTVSRRDAPESTLASFEVADGRPGVRVLGA